MAYLLAILFYLALGVVSPVPEFSFPVKFGLCRFPTSSNVFRKNDFFNKKWYVWKNLGNFFNRPHSCAGMDSMIVGDDIQLLQFQYEPVLMNYVSVRGDVDGRFVKFEKLVFPVHYSFGNYNFTMTFSILGTDYDNWAAVYFCHQLLGIKLEMSWLMTANRAIAPTEHHLTEMSNAIASVGFNLDDYHFQDNAFCGINEPHL